MAVDGNYFYAVDNRSITKVDKYSGTVVYKWEDVDGGLFIHLDSAMVLNGKIYAAHSNWRRLPMTSSIEVLDAETMQHVATHSFGRAGLGRLPGLIIMTDTGGEHLPTMIVWDPMVIPMVEN